MCTKTVGNKLVVQWNGVLYEDDTTVVQAQAILDPADNSIEFVYGAGQQGDGAAATIGVENKAGDQAFQLSYNDAGSVAPSTSKKLTPN